MIEYITTVMGEDLKQQYFFIARNNDGQRQRDTTKDLKILSQWKDDSSTWGSWKHMKEF